MGFLSMRLWDHVFESSYIRTLLRDVANRFPDCPRFVPSLSVMLEKKASINADVLLGRNVSIIALHLVTPFAKSVFFCIK